MSEIREEFRQFLYDKSKNIPTRKENIEALCQFEITSYNYLNITKQAFSKRMIKMFPDLAVKKKKRGKWQPFLLTEFNLKLCNNCLNAKSLLEFSKNKSYCKICDKKSYENKKDPGIYGVFELNTKSAYIGEGNIVTQRVKNHLNGKSSNPGIRKLAEEGKKLESEIIERCTEDQLADRQDYWIEYYRKEGWNILNVVKSSHTRGLDHISTELLQKELERRM